MTWSALPSGAITLSLLAAGCYHPPPLTPAQHAIQAECRQTIERQYVAQNRADLTRTDERDAAYSSTYDPGIPSRGLGAAYGREQDVDACERASGAPPSAAPGTGPAFNPARQGGSGSSLAP